MPIYEFYCGKCNTVFSFYSRTVDTSKTPACPKCARPLKRQMSLFAKVSRTSGEQAGDGADGMPPLDEAKMEKAMAMLAGEAEKIGDDDPRQAAQLMRKLSDATGMNLGSGMEEALSRLERGEDPDQVEAEMGDLLEAEEPFTIGEKGRRGSRKPKPRVDETLYDL